MIPYNIIVGDFKGTHNMIIKSRQKSKRGTGRICKWMRRKVEKITITDVDEKRKNGFTKNAVREF